MDIQEEKIAHEKHLLSQGVDFKYLPNIQYNELENVYELIEWDEEYGEALNEINSSWCTWQAAKAQAVPEGSVLVPAEPTKDTIIEIASVCLSPRCKKGDVEYLNLDEAKEVYQAAIKAQEPAND